MQRPRRNYAAPQEGGQETREALIKLSSKIGKAEKWKSQETRHHQIRWHSHRENTIPYGENLETAIEREATDINRTGGEFF